MSSAAYCGGMTEGVFPILSAHSKGEHLFSWLSGLPQRFCAAKALWDNFRAPAKIAWRVLWEEERQAYQVMRQTKRAADQTALPRRGGLFAACELGNAPLFGAFPDRGGVSLAPPRRWRCPTLMLAAKLRESSPKPVSSARRSPPRETVSCRRQDGGVVKPDTVTEGVTS